MFHFLEEKIFSDNCSYQNVLEVGAGTISHSLKFNKSISNHFLNDISRSSLNEAIGNYSNDDVSLIEDDFITHNFDQSFDLIIDSRFIHCITDKKQRADYLKKVFSLMKSGAKFCLETMVLHDEISFDYDLYYDYESSLLHFNNRPIRMILEASEVERQLLDIGFKIEYFRCFEDTKLITHPMREEALSSDPDVLRIVCVKP